MRTSVNEGQQESLELGLADPPTKEETLYRAAAKVKIVIDSYYFLVLNFKLGM